jgi:hypothetical protein
MRPPPSSGSPGESLSRIDWIGRAVVRQVDAADHVVDSRQRPLLAQLFAAEHLDTAAEGPGHRGPAQQLFQTLFVGRNRDRPGAPEAGGLPGLRLEFLVEVTRVAGEVGEILGGAQLWYEPCSVPGRTTRQLTLLQEHDVGHSTECEVVGDAATHDAATDDDDLGLIRKDL